MVSIQNVVIYVNQIRYMQYLASIVAALVTTSSTMYVIWSSPALPKLTSHESPVGYALSVEQASWVASTSSLGAFGAAFIKIFCAEWFGRRTWLLISGFVLLTSGIMLYFSKLLVLLYTARVLNGIGFALAFTTVPVYIAEISEKDIRGRLIIWMGILGLCGNIFLMTVGPFLSYYGLALCCAAVPLGFVSLFYFIPESPYYLVKNGHNNAAFNALKILSSKSANSSFIDSRLKEIEETVTYDMKNKSNIWEIITKREHRKAFAIILGAKGLLEMSGLHVINSYAQTIIGKASSSISAELSSLLFGLIQVPAAVLASFLVDNVGRKPLWIVSAIGCATALFGEGLSFYLDEIDSIAWMPTAALLLYYVMCPIGVSTLPLLIVGEIFSTNIKGAAVSLSVLYTSALSFLLTKWFEPIGVQYGMFIVFWIFSASCILGVWFIIFIVPETKGKTLEEIQRMLNKNRNTNSE